MALIEERKIFHESWYRISNQRICLRGSVKIRRQWFRGSLWYVLHDPFANQFFRLRPAAYRFVARLNLEQTFQKGVGTLTAGRSKIPVEIITIEGDKLEFALEEKIGSQKVTRVFNGLVNGNTIEGTVISKTGETSNKSSWIAQRDPSTIISLDDGESDYY